MNTPTDLIDDGGAANLQVRTLQGGGIVLGMQLAQQVLRLGTTMILARLISPYDYGLLGMVFTITTFMGVFADLGLSQATVQRTELSYAQISNLFWVNLGFGAFLAALTATSSRLVAWFYQEPELRSLTLWLSLGFLLNAAGTQHRALLSRKMQFGRLAVAQLGGFLLGAGAGIGWAARGWGAYSLVGQILVETSTTTLGVWLLTLWWPGLPSRHSKLADLLRFGGYLSGFNILNYFARNLDNILIGRFWGPNELGFYTRAYSLMTFPITLISEPMGRVMIPALSKLQHEPARYTQVYQRAMKLLALISFPLGAFLAVMAEEIIAVVYGSQWHKAVPIFRILCLASMVQAWCNSMGWLYLSTGKSHEMFKWGAVGSTAIALGLLPCIWWGALGAAVGYVVVMLGFMVPAGFWYVTRTVGLDWRPLAGSAVGPLLSSGLLAVVLVLIKSLWLSDYSALPKLVVLFPAGIFVYGMGLFFLARDHLQEFISLLAKWPLLFERGQI